MKTTRAMKPPLLFDTLSLVPLFSIAGFSLFVVLQWWSQPPLNPSFVSDPSVTFPIDQAATFSTGLVADPDNKPVENQGSILAEAGRCCVCGTEKVGQEKIARGGASLLHKWTDEELYRRAIAADVERISRTSTVANCASPEDALSGSSSRHRLRSGFTVPCASYCAQNGYASLAPGKVKIAFLFMITTSLPFEPLWTKFFEGHEGLYNIYVHADPFKADLFKQESGVFWDRLIPSKNASRGSPSLVLASNRLIANAMLDDPSNAYFALLSGHCIPVRSFDHVYRVITTSRRSFLEQIRNETVMKERYNGREGGEAIMLPEIPFEQFRKAAQWFVFLRRHALMILQDVQERKYWSKFDHKCMIYFCGTDEHYYPTFLNILDPEGVSGTTLTFVDWPDYVSEHPLMFQRDEVNRSFIMDIRGKDGGQYLFARKFAVDTLDLLMNMTDIILG